MLIKHYGVIRARVFARDKNIDSANLSDFIQYVFDMCVVVFWKFIMRHLFSREKTTELASVLCNSY